MLGFSFRGSRVSVFLRALVRRLYSATARRSLSAVRAGSGSVKMLNAESTICRSAKTTARESSGVKRTALERCIATPAQIAPRRQRRPSRTAITMARPPLAPARLRDPDGYVATRERSVPIFEFRSLWGRHVDFAESVHLCARIIALTACWPLLARRHRPILRCRAATAITRRHTQRNRCLPTEQRGNRCQTRPSRRPKRHHCTSTRPAPHAPPTAA